MAFNGSGLFNIDSTGQPVSANTLIESADFNALTADLATGLSNCVTKDGQQTVTANLPMAGFRHTGVGNAVARTDYAAAGQVQDGKLNWVDGGGTADAITATYSPAITALVDGQLCCVRATAANATTTPTFAPNGLTARTIVKKGGSALAAGDIVADGHELILRYDLANTRWELLNPGSYSSLGANTFTGLQTWSAGANIASAATLDLTAATGNIVRITGTTATSAVTLNNGQYVVCYAVGAWPLTYHATNHPVQGGVDYTCAAGDLVIYSKNASAEISVQIVRKDGQSVVASGSISSTFALSGDISPSQITANQNDYSPTGLSTASTLRLNSDASRDLTGLSGGADGRVLVLHNVGAQNIVLKDESASSTAANRFALSADVTIGADQAAVLQYDSTSSRWRVVASPSAGGSGGLLAVTTFTANGTWNKSTNNPSKIVVMAVGGGGGGGGGSGVGGMGGEAGAVNWAYTASPASSYAVTIGAGGSGGTSGGNGSTGSSTTFGALLTAAGGNGGSTISWSAGTSDASFAIYGTAGASCLGAGGAIRTSSGAGNAAAANTGAGGGGGNQNTGGAGGSGLILVWEFA